MSHSISTPHTALLLIDIQSAFSHPTHWSSDHTALSTWSTPSISSQVSTLLSTFRSLPSKPLIIHVRHASLSPASPLHPSSPGFAFYPFTSPLPSEPVLTKNVNSAFIGTELESMLRKEGVRRLYVAGITTDQCVSTTVRMASNLGVCDGVKKGGEGEKREREKGEIVLVEDACAAYGYEGLSAEEVHRVHVKTLGHEFCRVANVEEVVKEVRED